MFLITLLVFVNVSRHTILTVRISNNFRGNNDFMKILIFVENININIYENMKIFVGKWNFNEILVLRFSSTESVKNPNPANFFK